MTGIVFIFLFSLVVYAFQIGTILLIAAVIPYFVYTECKKKEVFIRLFVICLSLEIFCLAYLACHPFFDCPKEYREFVSEEDQRRIIGLNSGIYSVIIPVIPVSIVVTYADEDHIVVETNYILYGKTEMDICDDGPSLTQSLH